MTKVTYANPGISRPPYSQKHRSLTIQSLHSTNATPNPHSASTPKNSLPNPRLTAEFEFPLASVGCPEVVADGPLLANAPLEALPVALTTDVMVDFVMPPPPPLAEAVFTNVDVTAPPPTVVVLLPSVRVRLFVVVELIPAVVDRGLGPPGPIGSGAKLIELLTHTILPTGTVFVDKNLGSEELNVGPIGPVPLALKYAPHVIEVRLTPEEAVR